MSQAGETQDNIKQWDKYADLYDRNMGDTGDKFHREIIDPALMEVIGNVSNLTVLDAGCGNGYLARSIAELGAQTVIGIDGSSRLIQVASTRFNNLNITFQVADLMHTWPLDDNKIDVIVANMVLQYLPDIVVFAKEAKRVLKPRGTVVFSVDHPSHPLFMHALKLAGFPNPKFQDDTAYFETTYCLKRSLWDQAIIGYYHRPLSEYISPFPELGFCLTSFKELGRKVEIESISEVIPRVVVLGFRNV